MNVFWPLVVITIADAYTIQFLLYTSETQTDPIYIGPTNGSEYLKNDSDIRILITGWLSSTSFETTLKPALFSQASYNIIEVNYTSVSRGPYVPAVLATPEVAQQIGDFILNLTNDGVPLSTIQLIGYSLGAHVAGYVGKTIFKKLGQKLPRITAFDPSGPLFEPPLVLIGGHLNATDADVVFVIHTAMGTAGTFKSVGTVDVYPNGGMGPQPGCNIRRFPFVCSHQRSWMFYSSAVASPGKVMAAKCDSYRKLLAGRCNNSRLIDLGKEITKEDEGKYYLMSSKDFPLASVIPAPHLKSQTT